MGCPFGIVVGETSPQVLLLLLLILIKDELNYKVEMIFDDVVTDSCYELLLFSIYFDDSYICILLLICELTPSAGIAASWVSAGSED